MHAGLWFLPLLLILILNQTNAKPNQSLTLSKKSQETMAEVEQPQGLKYVSELKSFFFSAKIMSQCDPFF